MEICRYFSRKGGCARGGHCRYQHVQASDVQDEVHLNGGTTTSGDLKVPAPAVAVHAAGTKCRYFSSGSCRNGSGCPYEHVRDEEAEVTIETISDQNDNPAHPRKELEPNTRELGGALVTFNPDATISSIEPAATSIAHVQMCNVSCTWYQPSKTATIHFTSTQSMEAAAEILERTRILGRKLGCSTSVNRRVRPWDCHLSVKNLNTSTTVKMLVAPINSLGGKDVTFGPASYSSSAEEIGQSIRLALSSMGTVDNWTIPASAHGTRMRAIATFSSQQQASKAVAECNGHKLPLLGGSKLFVSRSFKAKFSVLTLIFETLSAKLQSLKENFIRNSRSYVDLKFYPPADPSHPFTILHIVSDSANDLAKAKAAVEKLLAGQILRGESSDKEALWNDFFLKQEGMAYLNAIAKENGTFIYRDVKKRLLRLYGDEQIKGVVESSLNETIESLGPSAITIGLNNDMTEATLQTVCRTIAAKLGRTRIRIQLAGNEKKVMITGSREDACWARSVLGNATSEGTCAKEDDPLVNGSSCAICWCDVTTEVFTTHCGHVYDMECFATQCRLAGENGDIPIRCLGSSGTCQAIFYLTELASALTREQMDNVLRDTFTHWIRTRPAQYQYCSTADCDQVYQVSPPPPSPNSSSSSSSKTFTCPSCLVATCTACGATSHEGLTCDQYKSAIRGDEAFAKWKRENDARDCPKCASPIQKQDGCNHMQCTVCKTHICWCCMSTFETGDNVYTHMNAEHGGCYDPGYGN